MAKGAFWTLFGSVSSRGLALLSSVFIARILGKEHFGEFGVIQSTVGMFGMFASFGMGMTATKYVAEYRVKDPLRAGRIIVQSRYVAWLTGGAMTVVLLACAPWLATRTLAAPHLEGALRTGAVSLLVGAVSGAQTGALSGFEAFGRIAYINLVIGAATFPLLLGGALWGGLEGAILGLVVAQCVNCVLNFLALRTEASRAGVPLTFSGCGGDWSVLWKFSLPAVLGGVMVGPVTWVCNAIVVNQSGGYGEMGLFNAANQWRQAIVFLPSMFASVAFPMLANLRGAEQRSKYRKVLMVNLGLTCISSVAVALPVAVLAPWIMARYGAGFVSGSEVLVCLCIVSVIFGVLNVVGQTIAAEGKMWFGLLLNAIWGVVLVSSCFALRHRGAMGLCLANLIAYSVHTVTSLLYVYLRMRAGVG